MKEEDFATSGKRSAQNIFGTELRDKIDDNWTIVYFYICMDISTKNDLKIIKNTFEEDVIKYFPGLVQSIKNSQPVFCCHLPTIKLEWMTSSILYGTWSVGYLQCKNIEDAKTV